MGYYTNFNLKVLDENEVEIDESFVPEWEQKELYGNDLSISDLIWRTADSMKWCDYHDEMLEYSKKYPEFVFILDGEEEESGDIWREFFKNGKSYVWQLTYSPPSFDESKLK